MFGKVISKIARHLDKANIPYMVIGGQAVLHYGEPRLTKDIDITLGVGIKKLPNILRVISKCGMKSLVRFPETFVKDTNVLPVVDCKSGIRADFIFSDSLYEKGAIKKSKIIKINKQPVRFAAVEDVIIQKIVAGRPRDIEDVEAILLKQKSLDIRYITKWLKQFEVALDISMIKSFTGLRKKSLNYFHTKKP